MKMDNKLYDVLKWLCIIVAPAFVTLLITLTKLWNWDIPIDAITGTISAVVTFIGILIGISNANYNKDEGDING